MAKMPEMTNEVKEQLKKYSDGKPVCCGCGGAPTVFQTNAGDYWFVECCWCHITTRGVLTKAGAVKVWNEAMGAK